jgi:cell division protein FtsZ
VEQQPTFRPSQPARPASSEREPAPAAAKPAPRQVTFDDDDLDVPDFLK